MIDINRETGTVTWDNFTLHSEFTHDEFVHLYPSIICNGYSYKYSHISGRQYQFPEIHLNNYTLIPRISFTYNKLDGVSFEMPDACYNEAQATLSMRQLVARIKSIRDLLTSHLGQTHRFNPHCFGFFDETLTSEEIDALQAWKYDFKWGGVQTCCFFDQGGDVLIGLSLGYNPPLYPQQNPIES